MNRLACPLLLVALLGAAPASRAGEPPTKVTSIEGVTEYKLPNGLRVLLLPDASKPVLTVHMTVLVGSRHEGYGETGMAHLLEHMLCKGTPTHPDIAKELRERGARKNATTSPDRTNFFETLPASDDNLDFAIRLEADRLLNCYLKREQLLTEMSVVRNEFERAENDPAGVLGERMMATAYDWHNYGKSVFGNRADIESVPIESLEAFYKKHYRVDNVVLTVTGQFDEAKALTIIGDSFGKLKRPERPLPPTYTREPAQDGERQVTLRRVGTVGAVGAVYHIPAVSHPDFAAIAVLHDCLTGKPGGRLYKALVESKKATGVSGSASIAREAGTMDFIANVTEPNGIDAAREVLIRTLESLGDNPITEEEVDRSRTASRAAETELFNSSEVMAHALGEGIAVGDWRLLFFLRDEGQKVTAADVNRVAKKYLVRNNRTAGTYYPTTAAERVEIPEAPNLGERLAGYTGRTKAAVGAAFELTPENIEKRVTRGTLGGIKTAFLPKPTSGEQVIIKLNLRYGNEKSLAGQTTAARMLPGMLLAGTSKHSRQQFNDELNKLGAGMLVEGSVGRVTITVSSGKANLPAVLKLVSEVLREPAFLQAEFDTRKASYLASTTAERSDPNAQAFIAVVRKLNDHPKDDIRYRPTIDESVERVKAVTLDQVKAVYAQLGAGVGELSAVGDFYPRVLVDGFRPILVGWESSVPYRRIAEDTRPIMTGERIVIATPDKANAEFVAMTMIPRTDDDPDHQALTVGTFVLGGDSMTSRIGNRVRRESGLSYHVEATYFAETKDKFAGFTLYASTNPVNMPKVRALMAEELARFIKDGVTEAELTAAKKAFREQSKLGLASDEALAAILADYLHTGRTFDRIASQLKRIEGLTPADIQKAFARAIDPAKLVIAEAGDFQKR